MREKNKTSFFSKNWTLLHHNKNKKTSPDKMEIKKFDPVVRKHVIYKESKKK